MEQPEIVRVAPEYQQLQPDEKADVLRILIAWAQFELSMLPTDPTKESPDAETRM